MRRCARIVFLGLMMAALVHTTGCLVGCGVGPVEGPHVVNGVLTFDPTLVGSTQQVTVSFDDSAGAAETITGASVSGAGAAAFTVLSAFPIDIPEGGEVGLTIQFEPHSAGAATATLTLQTMNMGPSPVELTGTGVTQ